MKKNLSKSRLGIILSKLTTFEDPKMKLEQYQTDSEIAADILWKALYLGNIDGKVIADLGCGTGILGLGALLLGAKYVFFIDTDAKALEIAKSNYNILQSEFNLSNSAVFYRMDIKEFNENVDIVLENPPFGVKKLHADKVFLSKAITIAPVVYSFHKSESSAFIQSFCKDNNFIVTHVWDFDFPLKSTYKFHKKRIQRTEVSCYRLERKSF